VPSRANRYVFFGEAVLHEALQNLFYCKRRNRPFEWTPVTRPGLDSWTLLDWLLQANVMRPRSLRLAKSRG